MDRPAEFVDLTSDRSQSARAAAPAAPPIWVALGAIAMALGLSLSLALPPTPKVNHGAVSVSANAQRAQSIREMEQTAMVDER